jgi:D-aminopeptidase
MPGTANAITDVPGVRVGHTTLIDDEPWVARTSVTVILPRGGESWHNPAFAGFHVLNGTGEMTGIHWLRESGLLSSPIALTNTHQVGLVRDALVAYAQEHGLTRNSSLPVVAETWDGWLNDMDGFHLQPQHVYQALAGAASGPVAEGNVGGGTGMVCHGFKGGVGTASRRVAPSGIPYTVGALVQANHGDRGLFRVDGVPVGREIGPGDVPIPYAPGASQGSLLVVIASDAPLLPVQCRRLAQRATIGMARCGGIGHNSSGDLFLAFATGNDVPAGAREPFPVDMLPHGRLDPLFAAAAEAVEAAILNALVAAETMTGYRGHVVHALPLDRLRQVMGRYRNAGR